MPKPKLNSGFFNDFSVETEDEAANNKKVEVSESGAEIVTPVSVQFADEEEEEDKKVEDKESEEKSDSKEDPKTESDDEDDDPFIATINHLSEKGLLVFDEDHEYEEEGEELLEKVFSETLEKRFQEEYIDAIPEEYQSILKHLKSGRPLDEWVEAIKPTDFDSINMEDESNQKQLIEDHLLSTGMDEDDVKEKVQEYEDSGTLEKNAKTAVKYLKKAEENKAKFYEQELEKSLKEQERQAKDDLDNFKKTVLGTSKLKDFELPKAKREKLLDHITKPVNNKGESQFVINQKSQENQLLLAFLDMEGYSLKDIKKAVETKVTGNLRKSLSKITDTNAKGNGGSTARIPTESRRIPSGVWDINTNIED